MTTKPDSPLERFRSLGPSAASPSDLLAVALSRRAEDAEPNEPIARDLLRRFGNIRGVATLTPADLAEQGMDLFESSRFLATVELGRRVQNAGRGPVHTIDGAADVFQLCDDLRHQKKEHFVAILLDAQNGVLRRATIHVGTLTATLVGAREVFREAVRDGASSIIVAHNHPSGDPSPSPEDVKVTRGLVEAGKLLDIPVLDHVVIGDQGYRSLNQMGLM